MCKLQLCHCFRDSHVWPEMFGCFFMTSSSHNTLPNQACYNLYIFVFVHLPLFLRSSSSVSLCPCYNHTNKVLTWWPINEFWMNSMHEIMQKKYILFFHPHSMFVIFCTRATTLISKRDKKTVLCCQTNSKSNF